MAHNSRHRYGDTLLPPCAGVLSTAIVACLTGCLLAQLPIIQVVSSEHLAVAAVAASLPAMDRVPGSAHLNYTVGALVAAGGPQQPQAGDDTAAADTAVRAVSLPAHLCCLSLPCRHHGLHTEEEHAVAGRRCGHRVSDCSAAAAEAPPAPSRIRALRLTRAALSVRCVSALYGVSAYLISTGEHANGHLLATVTSGALALTMANRWRRTGQAMPAALLTGIGAGAGVYNGMKWNEWRK